MNDHSIVKYYIILNNMHENEQREFMNNQKRKFDVNIKERETSTSNRKR